MNNDNKIYCYEYPFSKEQFLSSIPNGVSYYDDNYLIQKKNDMLFIGIGRLGHSSGRWYVAHFAEIKGRTIVSGKLVVDPDENGISRATNNKKETFGIVLLYIVLFPLIIIGIIGYFLYWIYKKIAKKSYNIITNEERLDYVMTNHFCCVKINETLSKQK